MKRSHPTILNPIHYENVRQPSNHLNIYFMRLAPDRFLSAVHIRAAASRGIYGFSRHISHSLLYQLSHIQSLYSTNVCHIYSSHICIPLHIKKKELHRDTFIHTGVFISSHRFFKGAIWEGISGGLSDWAHSWVWPKQFFPHYFLRSTPVGKVEEYGTGEREGGGDHLLLCLQSKGRLAISSLFSGWEWSSVLPGGHCFVFVYTPRGKTGWR